MYRVGNQSFITENISFERKKRYFTFKICQDNFANFIRSLDLKKTDGHKLISIHILQLCAISVSQPLQTPYKKCLDNYWFHQTWKKKLTSFVFIKKVISN